MTLILRTELKVADGTKSGNMVRLFPGSYDLERVPNPLEKDRKDWLVVKGTLHGGCVDWWNVFPKSDLRDGKEDCDVLILA